MRIEIDVSVANDPDAHRWLDRILHKIEDGWHVWDLTALPDHDELESTTWVRDPGRAGRRVQGLFVASAQRGAWTPVPHGRRLRVTALPVAEHELAPEDASRLANEPLVILVENRDSDGAFVQRIVKELDQSLHALWNRGGDAAKNRGEQPVRFDSLGGRGQMSREVMKRAGNMPYRPRLVAVVDSDRKGPDEQESQEARALRAACEKRGLSCWVLAKREAENYLPPVLLREKPNADDRHERLVDTWEALSDDQKDFFDMKRGLPDAPSTIEAELFDDLTDTQRGLLAEGFGPKVHECWTPWEARDVRRELLERGGDDLKHGIELIRKEV